MPDTPIPTPTVSGERHYRLAENTGAQIEQLLLRLRDVMETAEGIPAPVLRTIDVLQRDAQLDATLSLSAAVAACANNLAVLAASAAGGRVLPGSVVSLSGYGRGSAA